jgi:Nickel responsive protein SCO4226-like
MKYFIDTHDKTKGSFPTEELTEEQFFAQFDALEEAGHEFHVVGHAAHVNLEQGKAFCFMSGPDEDAIRKAHAAINLPYDSITEVRRVTGADMRSTASHRCESTIGSGIDHLQVVPSSVPRRKKS